MDYHCIAEQQHWATPQTERHQILHITCGEMLVIYIIQLAHYKQPQDKEKERHQMEQIGIIMKKLLMPADRHPYTIAMQQK